MPAVVSGLTVTERPYGSAMSKGALWVLRSSINLLGARCISGSQVIGKAPWLSPGGCPICDPDRLRRRALGSQQNSCPSGLYEFVLDALTLVEGPEPCCFDRRETISTVPYGSARRRRLSSLRKRDRV